MWNPADSTRYLRVSARSKLTGSSRKNRRVVRRFRRRSSVLLSSFSLRTLHFIKMSIQFWIQYHVRQDKGTPFKKKVQGVETEGQGQEISWEPTESPVPSSTLKWPDVPYLLDTDDTVMDNQVVKVEVCTHFGVLTNTGTSRLISLCLPYQRKLHFSFEMWICLQGSEGHNP